MKLLTKLLFIYLFLVHNPGGQTKGTKRGAAAAGLSEDGAGGGGQPSVLLGQTCGEEDDKEEESGEEEYHTLETDAMDWAIDPALRATHAQLVQQLHQSRAQAESMAGIKPPVSAISAVEAPPSSGGVQTLAALSSALVLPPSGAEATTALVPPVSTDDSDASGAASSSAASAAEPASRDPDAQSWVLQACLSL